jgi:4'-phosphopantetheinyl transferase
MPLYKTINHNSSTKILVWKISESFEMLKNEVKLNNKSQIRLNGMKSEMHQRGFLSIRKLLQKTGYSDFDLFYDVFGKPHLTDGKHISISHSYEFSTIIISDHKVGVDIEKQREKIVLIAEKFVNEKELHRLKSQNNQDYIQKLTVKWGAKEAIFKIRNEEGISFKDNIWVNKFEIEDKKTTAILDINNTKQEFFIYFEEIENFTLVYAFEK